MKRLHLLAVIYCIVHAASGDFAVSYEGMDQNTVTTLIGQLYKAPFDVVNQTAYDAFVVAHRPNAMQQGPTTAPAPH